MHNFLQGATRRGFMTTAALGLAAPALVSSALAQTGETVTVETSSGKLRGLRRGGVQSFKGISYAADTGGRNRFMAPMPVTESSGVRDALRLGDRCPQERETFGDASILRWYAQTESFSENCCVLNVFAPDAASRRRHVDPV